LRKSKAKTPPDARPSPISFVDETFAVPLPLEIPANWPRGEQLKLLSRAARDWKEGKPFRWRQINQQTGEESMLKIPLPPLPRQSKKPGAPPHPLTKEIIADIRAHHLSDKSRAAYLSKKYKPQTVAVSTVRRLRKRVENSTEK
jgi:hypothetical protein